MKKILFVLIPFLLICVFCLYTIAEDLLFSIIPGWHTTIFPSYFFISFIILVNFVFPFLFYWILSRHDKELKITVFIVHALLSTIIISLLKFPAIFTNNTGYDINQSEIESVMTHIKIIFIAFTIEQIIFGIYLIRILKTKTN